jgi:hypothetical protein
MIDDPWNKAFPRPLPPELRNLNFTDPITLNAVPKGNAWYLETDKGKNGKITTVYAKETLHRLLQRKQPSPMTRKPFTKNDIKKVFIPPDTRRKTLSSMLIDPVAVDYAISKIKGGETLHISTGSGQKVRISKSRRGTVNVKCEISGNFKKQSDAVSGLKAVGYFIGMTTKSAYITRMMTKKTQKKKKKEKYSAPIID